jgi:hypothetical protein
MAQLGSTNIGTVEVRQAIGIGVDDFGLLCSDLQIEKVGNVWQAKVPHVRANRINKWSLMKPISNNTFPRPTNLATTDLWRLNCASMTIASYAANSGSVALSDLLTDIENKVDGYTYNPPTGGADSPYCIDDFRLYTSDKNACMIDVADESGDAIATYSYEHTTGILTEILTDWDKFILEDLTGCLKFSDIWQADDGSVKLSDKYLTIAMNFTKNAVTYNKALSIGKISDLMQVGGISKSMPLLDVTGLTGIDVDGLQDVKRWYFLTTENVEITDVTPSMAIPLTFGTSFLLPIVKPHIYQNSFYRISDIYPPYYYIFFNGTLEENINGWAVKQGTNMHTDWKIPEPGRLIITMGGVDYEFYDSYGAGYITFPQPVTGYERELTGSFTIYNIPAANSDDTVGNLNYWFRSIMFNDNPNIQVTNAVWIGMTGRVYRINFYMGFDDASDPMHSAIEFSKYI